MSANPTKTWKVLTFLNPLDGKNFAYPDFKESDFTFESSEKFSEFIDLFSDWNSERRSRLFRSRNSLSLLVPSSGHD